MKCPIDQIEMIKGYFNSGSWNEGEFPLQLKPFPWAKGSTKPVISWRCRKCGKVEFTTEPEKEQND